jgi:modulator of FtsH protease HflK
MLKGHEKALIFSILLGLVTAGLDFYLYRLTGLRVFQAVLPFALMASAICGLILVRLRLARLSMDEQYHFAQERSTRPDQNLFDAEDEAPAMTLGRSHHQFELVAVPVISGVLALMQIIWAFGLYRSMDTAPGNVEQALVAMAFLLGQGFVCFLVSRFLSGLSEVKKFRLYRGAGISLGLLSVLSFLAAIGTLVGQWQVLADGWTGRALALVLAYLGIETIFLLVTAIYSPRRKTMLGIAYESRAGALVADPTRLARNFAETVDYQFGMQFGGNWYVRFARNILVPLTGCVALILFLLSSVVVLGPEEQGIKEHFGHPVEGETLDSGLHLKAPWPFATIKRIPAKRIVHTYLGYEPDADLHQNKVIVWTVPHYRSESMLLVFDAHDKAESGSAAEAQVSLLTVNIPVQYQVKDLHAYAYRYADPEKMMNIAASRVLMHEMSQRTRKDLLIADRNALSERLKERIQAEADKLGLGVEILFVGIHSIHPPTAVAATYQGVLSAIEGREQKILEAHRYVAQTMPAARAEAMTKREAARAFAARRKELAPANAILFEKQLAAYRAGGEVYTMRTYLRSLSRALKGQTKFVVDDEKVDEVITIESETKFSLPELLMDQLETKAPR